MSKKKTYLSVLLSLNILIAKTDSPTDSAKTKEKETTFEKKIKGMEKFGGLYNFYQDTLDGSVYMEINKKHINKEYIYFGHAHDGIVDVGFNRGSYRSSKVFSIKKYFNRIEFSTENHSFYFDKNNPLSRAESANITTSIMSSSKIIATDSTKTKYLIKGNDLFLTEKLLPIKKHSNPKSRRFSLGKLSEGKSKFISIRNYPKNSEVVVQYTYDNPTPKNRGGSGITDPRSINLIIQHSLMELPNNNFKPRRDDPRVGYFITKVTDMPSEAPTPYRDLIHRWNLTKKYPNKKISEPETPIVFWIENTTPYEFRSAVKEGVLAWNKSFKKAGFEKAIQVKVQPDNSEWDAGDIRYNVLRWTSSPSPPFGGYGPNFVNPKTGQILGADIMLEYIYVTNRVKYEKLFNPETERHDATNCNLWSYMHHENLLGSISTKIKTPNKTAQKDLIKESIINLVLHEVGHTLGLNHNFKSSHLHTIKEVNNKALTMAVGLSGSVMDYVPINLSKNQEKQGQYYSTVPGPYDDWAIQFGYSPSLKNQKEEEIRLEKILSRSTDPELLFGNDADDMRFSGRGIDPRAMVGDLTSEPINYSVQRIELMDELLGKIKKKYEIKGETFHALRDAFNVIMMEKQNAAATISRFIGGVYVDRAVFGQPEAGLPLFPVPYLTQKQAMEALDKHVFTTKEEVFLDSLFNYLQFQRRGFNFYGSTEDPKLHLQILYTQKTALNHILHPKVLRRIVDTALYGNEYSISNVFEDITSSIFKNKTNNQISTFRKNLQTEYVNKLIDVSGLKKENKKTYDYISQATAFSTLNIVKKHLKRMKKKKGMAEHVEFLEHKILSALNNYRTQK